MNASGVRQGDGWFVDFIFYQFDIGVPVFWVLFPRSSAPRSSRSISGCQALVVPGGGEHRAASTRRWANCRPT